MKRNIIFQRALANTIRGLKELVSIHFSRFRGKRIAYTTGHENETVKKFI